MDSHEMLCERVRRLERANRRMKAAFVVTLLGLCGVLIVGQSKPAEQRVIEADKIVLRDGQKIMTLTPDELNVRHVYEAAVAEVSISPKGLRITTKAGELSWGGSLDANGLRVSSPLMEGFTIVNAAGVSCNDAKGDTRLEMALNSDGGPCVTLCRELDRDASREYREALEDVLKMAANHEFDKERGRRFQDARDRYSKAQAAATAVAIGATSNVTPATGVTETRPANSICVYGPDGKLIWRIP